MCSCVAGPSFPHSPTSAAWPHLDNLCKRVEGRLRPSLCHDELQCAALKRELSKVLEEAVQVLPHVRANACSDTQ